MSSTATITTLLAIVFFIAPIVYKQVRGENTELSDLTKCTLAAMGAPDLLLCLYYLITNPIEAAKMPEAGQYLSVAALILLYITFLEIQRTFKK